MAIDRRVALGLVLALSAALLTVKLSGPPVEGPGYIHDECYQAFTAHRYALGDPDAWRWGEREVLEKLRKDDLTSSTTYEWVHPPFAKLVMAGFIRALGFAPWVYRLGSALCGWLCVLMIYLLGRRLYGERTALFAAALLPLCGLFFVMSRVAMNDIYVAAALLLTVLATQRTWTEAGPARRAWALASGAAAGIAIACKWNAAPTLIVTGLVVAYALWKSERPLAAIGLWCAAYLVIPALIYLACYAPYLALGHSLEELAGMQKEIWAFHKGLKSGHSSSSRWYEWPALVRPVWLYQGAGAADGEIREIYAFANPVLWWAMFPAAALAGLRAWRERSVAELFVAAPFFAVWLPWAVIGRVTFIQYVLPAVPFGVLAVVRAIESAWPRSATRILAGYGVAAVLCFASYYPVLTGMSVANAEVQGRRWFWFDAWRPCSGDCDAPASSAPGTSAPASGAPDAEDPERADPADTSTSS